MQKTEAPIIYNLFPKLAGPFSAWRNHFKRAKSMKFNWIFINPVQLPGLSGSMYSIKDYYQIDPIYLSPKSKFSADEQFKRVVEQAHKMGLKMMLDLVINHTAIDSVLIESEPKWYVRNEEGKIVNPGAMDGEVSVVWGDLAEIDNHGFGPRSKLWKYWEDYVLHLLSLGVDGFRCDAAYQVPTALWEKLIKKAKKVNPDVKFFAESLGCEFEDVIKLGNAGFDYTFNSSKWWDFSENWALEQYEENRTQAAPTISFPESHDTDRLMSEVQGNIDAVKMRYLFSALFSSGLMMPIGFEQGFRSKLHVVETRTDDWENTGVDLSDFISDVNQLKLKKPVFHSEGKIEQIQTNNDQILCLRKFSPDEKEVYVLILNKDILSYQYYQNEKIYELFEGFKKPEDFSVEYARDFVPENFEYHLRPAQIILLYAQK